MLKSPIRKIGGYGFFNDYFDMNKDDIWNKYGQKNGCLNKIDFLSRIYEYNEDSQEEDEIILGCVILNNCVFWDEDDYKDLSDYKIDFSKYIVKFKYYNEEKDPFDNDFQKNDDFELIDNSKITYEETKNKKRKDQAQFRTSLNIHYDNKCCISEEECTELLEAAHIQDYVNEKSNNIQNGLLLRVDFHKLFDAGLLAIDDKYNIHISSKVKSSYYNKFHGRKIHLPEKKENYPSLKALNLKWKSFRK